MSLPTTTKEWAELTGRPATSVLRDLQRGWCPWPRRTIDGRSKDSAYGCWENMIQRCSNPKAAKYDLYGGKGVSVCARWKQFPLFLADMGPRPSLEHSIDRLDSSGNYEPGNCRWATYTQQSRNLPTYKRGSITLSGRKFTARIGDTYIGNFKTEEEARNALDVHISQT